jgi:hypothetical protein
MVGDKVIMDGGIHTRIFSKYSWGAKGYDTLCFERVLYSKLDNGQPYIDAATNNKAIFKARDNCSGGQQQKNEDYTQPLSSPT